MRLCDCLALLSAVLLNLVRCVESRGLSLPIVDEKTQPLSGRLCALGDINKDRYTDLIVQKSNTLLILLQSESGTFKENKRYGPIELGKTNDKADQPVYCSTGDFNGDAALDILVTSLKEVSGAKYTYTATVYLNHEGSFSPIVLNQSYAEQPSVMDVNGDGISDILGMVHNGSIYSLSCFGGSRSTNYEDCQSRFMDVDVSTGPYKHFPHIFADLDGDLSSEIIFGLNDDKIPLQLSVWRLTGSNFMWKKQEKLMSLPDNPDYQYFGAPLVSDFNADAYIDILIPICREDACTHVDKFLVWSSATRKWESFQLDMKAEAEILLEPDSRVVFRVGEFSLDGYPDLIATVKINGLVSPLILENVHVDSGNFSRRFEVNLQKDSRLIMPSEMARGTVMMSSFFDLKEDGSLDILVEYKSATSPTSIDFIRCDDKGDTTFLKVQVFSNVCANDCPATPSSDSGSGISWSGACVSYSMSTSYGEPRVSSQCQLPQTSYRTLHSPFVLFGLGRSPNFVDEVNLGSPRWPGASANQRHVLKQIVPNSRVIVVPPERDDTHWQSRLYLTPSRLIIQSLLVQVTVCFILLALVVGLHMRERRYDRRERQSQSHRFHFDAM